MSLASIFQPRPLAVALALALTNFSAVAAEAVSYDQLDSELKILLRKLEAANEDAIAFREANPVIVTAGDKGFGLSSLDKNFDLKLRGFIQTDGRYFDQGIQGRFDNNRAADDQLEPVDNFLVRRARINIEGTVYGKYGFRITPDFAGNAVTLADAYVDANWLPQFKVRAGKFRPQVEIERTQGSPDYKFNETSLVTNFIPTRDVGVQISGDFAGNTLNYNIAYVNGANDGASGPNADVDTDKEIQARLLYSPFGNFQGLTVGLGGTTNDTQGSTVLTTLSSYRTAGQESFFQYDANVFGDGRRTRLIPQASYFTGNFGVFAEYIKEKQEVSLATTPAAATDRSNIGLEHDGWSITAAWTITGEEQSLKNIKPLQDFNPSKGGAGAWELVFRAGELSLDEETFKGADGNVGSAGRFADARRNARKAESVGVGVNWYLNKVVKVAVNYEDTGFSGGGGGTAANPEDRADERVLIGRVQANW